MAAEIAGPPRLSEQLPITPAIADFLRSEMALAKSPVKLILGTFAVTSVLPAAFTVFMLVQGRRFDPEWLIVWVLLWVIGGVFVYIVLSDASREGRDLAGGVFTRWTGPFTTRPVKATIQVVVDGRRLQTTNALPLYSIKSATGIVDFLPFSGVVLAVRDESGQVVWSRLPES
jgi:hypothetical protein